MSEKCRTTTRTNFSLQFSHNKVALFSYESKTTEKREHNDWRLKFFWRKYNSDNPSTPRRTDGGNNESTFIFIYVIWFISANNQFNNK